MRGGHRGQRDSPHQELQGVPGHGRLVRVRLPLAVHHARVDLARRDHSVGGGHHSAELSRPGRQFVHGREELFHEGEGRGRGDREPL